MIARGRAHAGWPPLQVGLALLALALLFVAVLVRWHHDEVERAEEQQRILELVVADAGIVAWLGAQATARITLSLPNPERPGAPLRYWVTAENGRRRVDAVVDADHRVSPSPLTLVCLRRDVGPVVRQAPPLACRH